MKVRIYQIEQKHDKLGLRFKDYETMRMKFGKIPASMYQVIYQGILPAENPEDVYSLLNGILPPTYQGHAMSVSDILEVIDGSEETVPGFYYCDTFGFQQIPDFEPEAAGALRGRRMVVLEPGKPAYETFYPADLENLQKAVGGLIECTYPFEDNAFLIGNEEAKLIGLEGNRRIGGNLYAGTLLIAADDGMGGTIHLTQKQADSYVAEFAEPEQIPKEEVEEDIGFQIVSFT